ncbi:MAG: hypothetical protein M3155_01425 [Actinomycetota bacterium]|nr:hypothetical protein [Candidatus Dormibacteraeota bacterium]MDQ6914454.1 hypothetical protein [Actinomycetota bacterium]
MPEGDTIRRTADGLRARVGGRTVIEAQPHALARLKGATLEAVEPVGKHLLMRFSGGWTLHSHMRLTGSWHIYRQAERWLRPARSARAVLDFGEVVAVCFSAPVVELVRDARPAVERLGPDILAADLDLDLVVARARAVGSAGVGELLLDQRVACGIGNVYRCEALWEVGVDPWLAIAAVPDSRLRELFEVARAAMLGNLESAPGPRRFSGGRRASVHGRRGRPCPRCGGPIASRPQGEQARWTYWCPVCQR